MPFRAPGGRMGRAALRLPRDRGASVAEQRRARRARRLPPRRRLLGHRRAGRPLGRHDDGLHPARGRSDGDAIRIGRPRRAPLRPARTRADPVTRSTRRSSATPGLDAFGGLDDELGFAVFTHRVAQAVAAMAVALGGLDVARLLGRRRREPRRTSAMRSPARLAFPRRVPSRGRPRPRGARDRPRRARAAGGRPVVHHT